METKQGMEVFNQAAANIKEFFRNTIEAAN